MNAITGMIENQVVQAGIKWIMGLLTPAGAFVKAAIAIIDVVKFFVERAAQIGELVQAFIGGVKAVASGNVKAVASAIENALAKAVPVVIGFLASLLGLSGLAQKVTGIFKKIHERVEKGIIIVWTKIKSLGASILSKLGIGKKGKDKNVKDERTKEQKEQDLDAGIKEGTKLLKDESLNKKEIQKRLEVIRNTYNLKELKIVSDKVENDEETVHIYGEVNPNKKSENTILKIKGVDDDIELKPNQAAIIKETTRGRHFKAVLPTGIMFDLTGIGDKIEIKLHKSKKIINVENRDSCIIVNVNEDAVKNVIKNASSEQNKYQDIYDKKKYKLGSVDCFTFAMDILNNRLLGDLKRNAEGEDNDKRFEDLKKGRK